MEKWPILGLGQEMYKMQLGCWAARQRKGVIKKKKKKKRGGSSRHGSVEMNLTSIHEDAVLSLVSLSGLRIQHCRDIGRRHSSGPVLL